MTMLSPHTVLQRLGAPVHFQPRSSWQAEEQPSSETMFLSSHVSPAFNKPLPQAEALLAEEIAELNLLDTAELTAELKAELNLLENAELILLELVCPALEDFELTEDTGKQTTQYPTHISFVQ